MFKDKCVGTKYYSGKIINGGKAFGNGFIGGIIDQGEGNFEGSTYFHSGLMEGASIGPNGFALCYSVVLSGVLSNRILCNQAYDPSKNPDTISIDDYINNVYWPSKE